VDELDDHDGDIVTAAETDCQITEFLGDLLGTLPCVQCLPKEGVTVGLREERSRGGYRVRIQAS
jgi:hypothetical protein